jgi:hypothetical protein
MELDRALELAVVSSWGDLAKGGDPCSVRVEYRKVPNLPLDSLEVWTVRNRGYGTLVCRYSVAPSNSPSLSSEVPRVHFANFYHSKVLSKHLQFIMRNQERFTRPADRSIHGWVRIDCPSEADRKNAAVWSRAARTDSTGGARHDDDLAIDVRPDTS